MKICRATIIDFMRRGVWRVLFILLLILLVLAAPVILSGYSELKQAGSAESYNEIAEHYLRAAQRLPWRADLYELAGHAYYHAKEYQSADDMYRTAFEKNSLSPEGWAAWGDVNYLSEDKTRAVEIWTQALQRKDFSDGIYLRLAHAKQEQGEYAGAADYLQKYVTNQPVDAATHYQLGLLLTLTDPDQSASELTIASQLDGQFDPAARTLLAALSRASRVDSSSQRFVVIGAGLGAVNEWELARAAFESAVRADDTNAEAWAWLGEANQQTVGGGIEELNRALELNPNSSVVRGLRGIYFQRIGNHRDALTEFQTAASFDAQNPARFVSLGDAYALTGDLIRALESFQYAASLAPGDATYWRALADFCGRYNIHIEDIGVPAAQRAVMLEDDVANKDALGWLLLLDARYPEAERILLDALKDDPQNASVYFHLGLLYLQSGDRSRAIENLIHARDLGNSQADDLLKQLSP